jgi:hypothetical protein
MEFQAQIRRFVANAFGRAFAPTRLTQYESLSCSNLEDFKAESARAGMRFHGGCQIIANGIAPVAAIPTTTATLALFNPATSGKTLGVHKINFWLGSGTPAAGATLFGTVSPAAPATPVTAMATGYGVGSSSGGSRLSKTLWGTAVTLPTSPSAPSAPAWFALSSSLQVAAANVGQGDGVVELESGLLVPPGFCMGFAILSGAGTTPLYGISATWSEYDRMELE